MQQVFKVLSLSHLHAPIEIRELIYLSPEKCRELIGKLSDILGIQEAIVFSTCNRTEIYYVSEEDLSQELIGLLFVVKGLQDSQAYRDYFHHISNHIVAVNYVFEVSMGLHSSVLGDLQISNQVKQAYSLSHEAGMANAFIHRLMHTIFHTHKRVHQETSYRDGAASVSYAAAELAEELVSHLKAPKVLVLGLGEMGRDVALTLDQEFFSQIYLCNRSLDKAHVLAEELGVECIAFEELPSHLDKIDVIISAVSVEEPLLTAELMQGNSLFSQYVIDLSVPRSVATEVDTLSHVVVYNVDDIHTRTQRALEKRKSAIPHVKSIIGEEVEGFLSWSRELELTPTIHKIKASLEKIRQEEMARFIKNASEEEAKLLDEVTKNMVHKILRMPVLQLKAACKRGEQAELIDVLNELFDLEASNKSKQSI